MNSTPIISVKNFSMSFRHKQVIKDLSFDVERGDVFGFLGANGSGKTTTIRALLGIYPATAGTLHIDGKPFQPDSGISLGYLPEERGLYKKEAVLDTMLYFGQLKGMSRANARAWSLKYLERVELGAKAGERLDKLSGGQQQKVQLGVTIMNHPQLLILDEPTKGFDPVNRRLMLDIVQESRTEGATVVLVTHQMEEAERLCNRLILLKDGARRLYGSMSDIKSQYASNTIEIEFDGSVSPNDTLYKLETTSSQSAVLTPMGDASAQQIMMALAKQADLALRRFEVMQASLDDIFVQIYSGEANHA